MDEEFTTSRNNHRYHKTLLRDNSRKVLVGELGRSGQGRQIRRFCECTWSYNLYWKTHQVTSPVVGEGRRRGLKIRTTKPTLRSPPVRQVLNSRSLGYREDGNMDQVLTCTLCFAVTLKRGWASETDFDSSFYERENPLLIINFVTIFTS